MYVIPHLRNIDKYLFNGHFCYLNASHNDATSVEKKSNKTHMSFHKTVGEVKAMATNIQETTPEQQIGMKLVSREPV